MEKKKTPQIRFAGFTDPWEQCEVKDVCNIETGKSNTQDQNPKGDYPFYIRSDKPVRSNKYLYDCEAVITIGDGNIGQVFHYVNGKFDLHQRCYKMTDFQRVDGRYFYYFFSTRFYDRVMRMSAKATVDSVRLEMISDMPICYPCKPSEQKKIAEFFSSLDKSITLHQRKCEKLKLLKKSMLEKMFPKNGKNVPEVRFAGFTDAWEQCKLGEIAEIKTGYPFSSDEFTSYGDFLVITNGNIQNGSSEVDNTFGNRIFLSNNICLKEYILNKGDILVTMDGTVGRTAKVVDSHQVLAQRVGRVIAKNNSEFIYQWLSSGEFYSAMSDLSHGGTIKHISLLEISSYKNLYPNNPAEQQKIGSFFSSLDRLLTLHQRKCEKLKIIKKSMLEKMFV